MIQLLSNTNGGASTALFDAIVSDKVVSFKNYYVKRYLLMSAI